MDEGSEMQDHAVKDRYRRRMAMQIAGQLPDDLEDARAIVDYMRELVESFLTGSDEEKAVARRHLSVVSEFPGKKD